MRNWSNPASALALIFLALGLSKVAAQEASEPPAPEPPPQTAPAQSDPADPDGEQNAAVNPQSVLERSRETLISVKSLRTRMIETVQIGSRRFRAEGTYVQGTDLRLRLELAVRVGGLDGELIEVCDGAVLLKYRRIGETARVTRRDVRAILSAASASPANLSQAILTAELGLGGLPALLASIEQTMTFDSASTQSIDGEDFDVIEGPWNSERRKQFDQTFGAGRALPEHIPDRVRLYFDGSNLPRRIVYLKRNTASEGLFPMVSITFEDMVVNSPIEESQFRYDPPEHIPREDITHQYIQRLQAPAAK